MKGRECSECQEHPGEKKKLFCYNPCNVSLCQNYLKNHKKHDIRALVEIVEEMTNNIEKVKIEKNTASILCKNQIDAIDKFIADFERLVKHYEEEKQKNIKVIAESFNEILQQYKDKVDEFISSLREKREKCAGESNDRDE
jgi:DNA-binding transcriptional regulator GbsR (MarR family)